MWAGEPVSWTVPLELAASQLELTHALCRLLMQLGGAKRAAIPKPLVVPRPQEPAPTGPRPFDLDGFQQHLAAMTPRG